MPRAHEDGYASVSAIILCAALSLLCAGVLGLVMAQKQQAKHDLERVQSAEAINTALLELGADIAGQQGDTTLTKDIRVEVPGGTMTVKVRAEYEGRKWPSKRMNEIEPELLSQYLPSNAANDPSSPPGQVTAKDANQMKTDAKTVDLEPKDDCLRSLFSPYGQADITQPLPKGIGVIAVSGGHDGQVWRLRATLNNRLEERRVRFLGDPLHLYAIISDVDYAYPEMPNCKSLKVTP